jgi:hypothetical protein
VKVNDVDEAIHINNDVPQVSSDLAVSVSKATPYEATMLGSTGPVVIAVHFRPRCDL